MQMDCLCNVSTCSSCNKSVHGENLIGEHSSFMCTSTKPMMLVEFGFAALFADRTGDDCKTTMFSFI